MPSLQGVILKNFWDGEAMKIPKKMKAVGFVSRARLCHEHKMNATASNFFFWGGGVRKKEKERMA
jgi:hypothetical protein